MFDNSVYDVLVCLILILVRVLIVDFTFPTNVYTGFSFCLRWSYTVGFINFTGRWRGGKGLVSKLNDQYSVNTDSVEDAFLLDYKRFWMDFHYFVWAGFTLN